MTETEQIVDRFISTWAAGDVEGMLTYFTDDVRAQNMPMDLTVGVDAIRELQTAFFAVATDFRIEVHRQVVDGNFVMQERTDFYTIGDTPVELPICGVFEIENGRIVAWREYFDLATSAGQSTAST